MKYSVEYLPSVIKTLKKMDQFTRRIILNWIENNLVDCEDPRIHGKALTADRKGQWRYRVGDYRVICLVKDSELIVLAINIGHRKEIYL